MPPVSNSSVQLEAEAAILQSAAALLKRPDLRNRRINLPGGSLVEIDGATDDMSVFVVVVARQGPLKGGQKRKVALDVLKLITLRRHHRDAKLCLAFCSDSAKASITGWVAEAIATWHVRTIVLPLEDELRERLLRTQALQGR
jgi:hypothetical protein